MRLNENRMKQLIQQYLQEASTLTFDIWDIHTIEAGSDTAEVYIDVRASYVPITLRDVSITALFGPDFPQADYIDAVGPADVTLVFMAQTERMQQPFIFDFTEETLTLAPGSDRIAEMTVQNTGFTIRANGGRYDIPDMLEADVMDRVKAHVAPADVDISLAIPDYTLTFDRETVTGEK